MKTATMTGQCAACQMPCPDDRSACFKCCPEPEPQPPQDVWHVGYNGPRCVKLKRIYGEHRKAVVEHHGSLELVDVDDVYDTDAKAYTAAWLKEMESAQKAMNQAAIYKRKADELRGGK